MAIKNHIDIIKRLCDHNCDTYLVGGGIRDMLAGLDPQDFDVVTSATPEMIEDLFSDCSVKNVGKSFGVVLVNGYEVATFRHDRYCKISDENPQILFASSIGEDLSRRDFTINAMAYCELTGEIVDNHGGQEDLKRRIIRFVGDPLQRIQEDPNRIIRACRFLAKLDGEFDVETREALTQHAHYVGTHVAPERIRLEILKAMELGKPSLFFMALHSIDALRYIFPSMVACVEHPHGKYHSEDVFVHLMFAGDIAGDADTLMRLAMFLHDVGKPRAFIEQDDGSFIHHDTIGVRLVQEELKALKFANDEISRISNLISVHMANVTGISDKGMRKLLHRLAEKDISFDEFLLVRAADRAANRTREPFTHDELEILRGHAERVLQQPIPVDTKALSISGGELMKELGLSPGPEVGALQRYLLSEILEKGQEINNRETLLMIARDKLNQSNGGE